MFQNDELLQHLETNVSISTRTLVTAEWNMNVPGNIQKLGNYRYRKNSTLYSAIPNFFDVSDSGNFYTGATDADVLIDSGFVDDEVPLLFKYPKQKESLYYSLEDCIKPHRPRSGINKLSYFNNKYLPHPNVNMFLRPRYYMPTKNDEFKYWRSYRQESANGQNFEVGISKNNEGTVYPIDDCAPFVVYKEAVPANKLVIKVQTNVGSVDLGPFKTASDLSLADPFFGETNKTVPQNFRIQYLDQNNNWIDTVVFTDASLRPDGSSPIFGTDGYLSVEYGLKAPYKYASEFRFINTFTDASQLPTATVYGYAYLVRSGNERGLLYVYNGSSYDQILPEYGWDIGSDDETSSSKFVTSLTEPSYYKQTEASSLTYREIVFVKGIRLVVDSMKLPNVPLELIELSSRLVADISDAVTNYNISKSISDLTSSALPVGSLMASTGTLNLFDDRQAFSPQNVLIDGLGSIVAPYLNKNIAFKFYEIIENVGDASYAVPIKTMYAEGIPQPTGQPGNYVIQLRDLYYHFESVNAPRILLTEVSLTQAVCLILDSIGFVNYTIKRLNTDEEKEPVIPYFFVAPDKNVAEVLQELAVATQSAMFFDEYNNFVVMTKEYLMDEGTRPVDITLFGSPELNPDGSVRAGSALTNILSVASQDTKVFNAGSINYTARYIQRSYASLQQSRHVDKTWVYKPALLWEVAGTEATTTANAERQQKFVLGAMPLNSDLDDVVPFVRNHVVQNNIMDVGENAYWITRFKGFLYANGEIIKYDAVEYSITGSGNVWISSNLEYQKYFASLPFNGKIYPTGLIRIYSEPFYETRDGYDKLKNGPVVSHGRGQFGTPVVYHNAGLNDYWINNNNVRGLDMKSEYLYTTEIDPTLPSSEIGPAGVSNTRAQKSQRNGIIKNFISSQYASETDVASLHSTTTGTVQSSALVMTGPTFETTDRPRDFVSYVHKPINGAFKHFGTRMRIIGKVEAASDRAQSPVGGMTYLNIAGDDPTKTITIGGGSGGISLVDPTTNVGYYFELAALTTANLEQYLKKDDDGEATVAIENILFYKVKKDSSDTRAIPQKLWGGLGNVIVDDGNFTGQYRFVAEDNPTVYDLAIEYVDLNPSTRQFYLYINNKLVKTVVDREPITMDSPSIGLFVRGTSKLMFENVYALGKNYANNSVFDTNLPIASSFGDPDNEVNALESLTKYAISGVIQNTYLTTVSASNTPDYQLYFEEFGTIMREAAYFNVKYDRAYPALYAKISPTFNRLRGYTVSGFTADSYGAEFLVFNNTDTLLNLDETTGNYLRIQGVTFTQDTTNTITVDDYLQRRGNLSDPELQGDVLVKSPYTVQKQYDEVRVSRLIYGRNEFTLNSNYIQDQETAENLMGWLIKKNIRPRKAVGVNIFAMPIVQLGDIITFYYSDGNGRDVIATPTTRFVVYNISYTRTETGPEMTVYVCEV